MSPHAYTPAHGGTCTCGLWLYHEMHFGGSRAKAAEAYRNLSGVVPTFATQEEADTWLRGGIPAFKTPEEADEWLEKHRPCKECGALGDHNGRACSSIPRPGGPPRPGEAPRPLMMEERLAMQVIYYHDVFKPGDMVKFTW